MRVIETIIAALMVLILWPVVLAAAIIPLAWDWQETRQTKSERDWLGSEPIFKGGDEK